MHDYSHVALSQKHFSGWDRFPDVSTKMPRNTANYCHNSALFFALEVLSLNVESWYQSEKEEEIRIYFSDTGEYFGLGTLWNISTTCCITKLACVFLLFFYDNPGCYGIQKIFEWVCTYLRDITNLQRNTMCYFEVYLFRYESITSKRNMKLRYGFSK